MNSMLEDLLVCLMILFGVVMRTPRQSKSSESIYKLGLYTIAKLQSNPKTRHLAVTLKEKADLMISLSQTKQRLEFTLMSQEGVCDYEDEQLDLDVRYFSDSLFNESDRDRQSARYLRMFSGGLASVIQHRLFSQLTEGRKLVQRMESVAEDEPLAEIHLPKIKAGLENLENALEPYRNTLNELQNIKTDEFIAKKEFIATYVSTYGAVVQVMGSKKQSESFFKKIRSKK